MNCKAQTVVEVTYNAQTRGAYETIQLTKDIATYTSQNKKEIYTLTDAESKQLKLIINQLDLGSISGLVAPTEGRFSDKAMIANITIKKDKELYQSSDFDHGNPPEKLQALVSLLRSFTK